MYIHLICYIVIVILYHFFVINELYTILYSVYHKLLIYLYLQVLKGYLPKGKYFAMVDVLSETQQ